MESDNIKWTDYIKIFRFLMGVNSPLPVVLSFFTVLQFWRVGTRLILKGKLPKQLSLIPIDIRSKLDDAFVVYPYGMVFYIDGYLIF